MIEYLYKSGTEFQGTFYIKFLDCSIDINISKSVPLWYVKKCLNMLDSLPDNVIDDLCKYSIRCFEDFKTAYEVGLDEYLESYNMPKHVEGREILKYISPAKIKFTKIKDYNTLAVDMDLDCKWESNYGMEWVIRNGKIVYVGFYEGLGAWVEDGYTFGNYTLNEHPFSENPDGQS